MLLKDYIPHSQLVREVTEVNSPRFRVVDFHNHLSDRFGSGWTRQPIQKLLDVLDAAHVDTIVDLDGGWGEDILRSHLETFKQKAPERFVHFGGVAWERWPEMGDHFAEWAAGRLARQAAWGAQGIKIWKNLGLHVRDGKNNLAAIDDPCLDPIWQTAAECNLPVLIHIADPVAFFQPLDEHNERWEELSLHPDWHFPNPPYPTFDTLIESFARLVLHHPQTRFIGAHVGCFAENLDWVSSLLERASNLSVDISARMAELGRQPFRARKFFMDHADRILFGTDLDIHPPVYALYYRFLETRDEYFDYDPESVPSQGRWKIYGLDLPDPVLQKVYSLNANGFF